MTANQPSVEAKKKPKKKTLAEVPSLLENYFHVTSKKRSDREKKGDEDGAERPNQSHNRKQQRVNVWLQQNPEMDLERTKLLLEQMKHSSALCPE